jgi:hypothetical protein
MMKNRETLLQPCALSDLGQVKHSYSRGRLLDSKQPVLAIRIEGDADSPNESVFDLAAAIIMAGLEAWQPWAVVLDLRAFKYSWGDEMQNALSAPQRWYGTVSPVRAAFSGDKLPTEIPLAVIVSELNRDGLASLLREQMHEDPSALLYESIDDAFGALDKRLLGVPLL